KQSGGRVRCSVRFGLWSLPLGLLPPILAIHSLQIDTCLACVPADHTPHSICDLGRPPLGAKQRPVRKLLLQLVKARCRLRRHRLTDGELIPQVEYFSGLPNALDAPATVDLVGLNTGA